MKKIISFLLATIMIISISVISAGASTVDATETAEIVNALNSVECIKDQLGLGSVNFEHLSYSRNHIYAYDYTDDGFVYNSEFIPIIYANCLIGWIIKATTETNTVYQFSTAFVNQVNSIVTSNMNIAFIYDYNACYLYDGNQLYKLGDISLSVESRSILNSVGCLNTADVTRNELSEYIDLEYSSLNTNARTPIYYSCNVSFVTQNPPSNMCWAASAACITNYFNGTSHTAASVAQSWYNTYSNYNLGLSLGLQDDVLRNYGISYTYRNQVPSDGIIFNNIYNGYPIQATFKWSNGYHDVVIYGINITGGYIYIMDPEYGFCSATSSTSTGHTYISGYSGVTLSLNRATCKYWIS